MRALIKVGYRCNHACIFCHAEERRGVEAPRADVDALIDRAAALGFRMVVLSGGEATLRPELLAWADRCRARGLAFGLVTNAVLLDPAFVAELVRRGLRYVHLSLHAATPELHARLAGAPTLDRVLGALRALSGRGLELWVNCVVTRLNLDHLRGVVELVRAHPDAAVKFSLVEPRGAAARQFEALVPRVTDAAPRIQDAIAAASAGAVPLRTAHDFVPLCLLPGAEHLRSDLRAQGFRAMAEVGEPDLFPVDDRNMVHPPRCDGCALRGRCPGLFTGYVERHGDGELRPVASGPRSNSFNYVFERRVGGARAACPVAAIGCEPWDRGRDLFVRNGERVALFRAETRDFTDADIANVKHRRGQLYVDVSHGDAPEDFARDLVKLRRADTCVACPEAERCTGLYEPMREDVFGRDDARVLEVLRELRGDVLDVGCGDGRYLAALADAAADRAVRYTGIEPDAARAVRLRARWPWARVLIGEAETLALDAAAYDHAVVLRSWNHLRSAPDVVRAVAAAVRRGGTVTVVDNEAFGLVRSHGHAARAERSVAAFEHHRNDGAAEAHATVGAMAPGLRLVERREVGPATSNQWMLRYVVA